MTRRRVWAPECLHDPIDREVIAAELRATADEQHAEHAQYRDHWNSYVAVRVVALIIAHGYKCADVGEFVLMRPGSYRDGFVTVYLARNLGGCDTSVRATCIDDGATVRHGGRSR